MDDNQTTRAKKPWSKWSADTEQAFLLALRLTGQASKAAAEIGRSKNTAFSRRRADPEFARKWDEAVAAQQAEWVAASRERLGPGLDDDADGAGGGRLTPWRDKAGGWDARKRGLFLRNLGRGKNVAEACAAAGMSESAAYYLRGQSPRFAAAWEKALRGDAPPSVLDAAMERAVHGWVEPIVAGGKVIGERRRYSDSLLKALVDRDTRKTAQAKAPPPPKSQKERTAQAEAAATRAGGTFVDRAISREDAEDALMYKLDIMEAQMEREERAEQAADWERWQAGWLQWGGPQRAAPAPPLLLLTDGRAGAGEVR